MSLQIRCPTCDKFGKFPIKKEEIESSNRGIFTINIPSNTICPHSFIIYLDRHLNIRDYIVADFHIEIPEIDVIAESIPLERPDETSCDINLIKEDYPMKSLACLLKSIFYRRDIILVIDKKQLSLHILNLIEWITYNNFEANFSIINSAIYKKENRRFKNCVILNGINMIKDNKNVINLKKIKVEMQIIKKFYEAEIDHSLIFLKNELQKAYEFSKLIYEMAFQRRKSNQEIQIFGIMGIIEKKYSVKISSLYLNLLSEIVENYFKFKIPSMSESFLKL